MAVWKGGAGVKAPYETTHVRIPVPIKEKVAALSQAYKDGVLNEPLQLSEAIQLAKHILAQKKSASKSIKSLLTGIYGCDVEL
jgi:hypothetical protein